MPQAFSIQLTQETPALLLETDNSGRLSCFPSRYVDPTEQ